MQKDKNNYNCDPSVQTVETFADWLMTLSPFEFTSLAVVIGYLLSCNLTVTQQNSVGNWFELLGQIILTFNAQASGQINNPTCREFQEVINKLKRDNNLK